MWFLSAPAVGSALSLGHRGEAGKGTDGVLTSRSRQKDGPGQSGNEEEGGKWSEVRWGWPVPSPDSVYSFSMSLLFGEFEGNFQGC